jgi:D-3-phosphoglycerate dehydrogenase
MGGMNRPKVIVTEGLDPAPMAWLRERAEVIEADPGAASGSASALGAELFLRELPTCEALVVRTYTRVNAELLGRAPKLRVVGRGGVGLENIDISACRSRGVEVVYTPDANTRAVGEYVIGLLLQMIRPYGFFRDHALSSSEFKKVRNEQRGRQLDEMTLGIVGMGRVGRRLGRIASLGFGMRVVYRDLLDVREKLDFPAEAVSMDELLARADVLSLHVDMRPGNEHLIGKPELSKLKQGAYVVNTSRGEVLDAHALAEALRDGRVAGAALDVYHPEPPGADFPLLGMRNVLLAPHMAARTYTAIENMSWVVRDVMAVLEGRPPAHPAP